MGGRAQATGVLVLLASGALTACGGGGGGAIQRPHAGSYEAFDGAGRHQHFALRLGDRLQAAISDRGLRPCLGAGRGCVRFSSTGAALVPLGDASASTALCNDAKRGCVYAREGYRTARVGHAVVQVAAGARTLMTVDVDVRKAPPGYTARATAPRPLARGSAATSAAPPLGLYKCYQFDPTTGYLYAGPLTLVDATSYQTTSDATRGTYQANGDAVRFTGGPYAEFTGKRRQDSKGNEVIDLTLQSDPHVKLSCDHVGA
jgi:hypothetical protein